MLRKTITSLPLLNPGAAARRVARNATTKQLKPRRASTKSSSSLSLPSALAAPIPLTWPQQSAQLWAQRLAKVKEASARRVGPFRASVFPARRPFHSSRAWRAKEAAEQQPTTLGGRLKKLSREYGWAAVGVYAALSVLDFPFCFLLVRTVGTERIAEVEHVVVSNLEKVVPERVQTMWHEYRQGPAEKEVEQIASTATNGEGMEAVGWGVQEADARRTSEGASLATQLALAYAIHKSFIFVRVPLAAAILPKVVKVLRGWGWQIGKRRVKP
ncbi:hypothetical protein B0T25DRAFT_601662 [Lasiosphaeria hispida]|uniref:DUF1279 domain-containing protein n=1 Tax=Lasiosphaeria hispida TaxID=260671 RepID=A0AAJ0HS54_9PEZI|nr:hypothetical protein B0T25DRAFT_601662 [Lasiosphaeria hispida]